MAETRDTNIELIKVGLPKVCFSFSLIFFFCSWAAFYFFYSYRSGGGWSPVFTSGGSCWIWNSCSLRSVKLLYRTDTILARHGVPACAWAPFTDQLKWRHVSRWSPGGDHPRHSLMSYTLTHPPTLLPTPLTPLPPALLLHRGPHITPNCQSSRWEFKHFYVVKKNLISSLLKYILDKGN